MSRITPTLPVGYSIEVVTCTWDAPHGADDISPTTSRRNNSFFQPSRLLGRETKDTREETPQTMQQAHDWEVIILFSSKYTTTTMRGSPQPHQQQARQRLARG